jgi:hypothetical protein
MGAPTALAAVTVSARRRGLPQHRGQTPKAAKRNDRIQPHRARFGAEAGGAYQPAAAAAFVQALRPATRARAFGLAQSGPYAVQGLWILADGAVAEAIGAPLDVGLAGLVGLTAAAMLAASWTSFASTWPRLSNRKPRVLKTAAC